MGLCRTLPWCYPGVAPRKGSIPSRRRRHHGMRLAEPLGSHSNVSGSACRYPVSSAGQPTEETFLAVRCIKPESFIIKVEITRLFTFTLDLRLPPVPRSHPTVVQHEVCVGQASDKRRSNSRHRVVHEFTSETSHGSEGVARESVVRLENGSPIGGGADAEQLQDR